MPYKVVRFQPTPNPNAMKCILDASLGGAIRSYRSADQASQDPLGAAMFAIPGVTSVLLSGEWLTVNKSEAAEWSAVQAGVRAALAEA